MSHRHHKQPGLYLDASSSRHAAVTTTSPLPQSRRRGRPDSSSSSSAIGDASGAPTTTTAWQSPLWLGGGGGGDSSQQQQRRGQQQDQLSATSILLSGSGVVGGRASRTPASASSSSAYSYDSSTRHYHDNDTASAAFFDVSTPFSFDATTATTALTMARQAPIAGYLNKLGTSVRKFKRRFFVLQPTTTLYYFLSPDDVEPRGCVDLEGATIVPRFHDHVYQFAIQLPASSSNTESDYHGGPPPPVEVLLEARSETDAQQWMQTLQNERIDVIKAKHQKALLQISAYKSRVMELEKRIDAYKLVEADRDGALEDAAQWKIQFERLDEAVRQCGQELTRGRTTAHDETNDGDDNVDAAARQENGDRLGNNDMRRVDAKTRCGDHRENKRDETPGEDAHDTNTNGREQDSPLVSAKCQGGIATVGKLVVDPLTVPGRHFSTLWNAMAQMKENFRLAAQEAATAVDDVQQANATVQTLEKRMAQAETHLCKIWEENCELRKTVKHHKREKRLLVNEVKNLREQQKQQQHQKEDDEDDDIIEGAENDEEQKLLDDIEAHVQASIDLQRELVGGTDRTTALTAPRKAVTTKDVLDTSRESEESSLVRGIVGSTLRLSCGPTTLDAPCRNTSIGSTAATKIPVMASLFDNDDDDDSDSSSVCSIMGQSHGSFNRNVHQPDFDTCAASEDDYSQRSNPMDKLDEIDLHDDPPRLIAVSSSSSTQSKPSAPTSQLLCLLADVASSTANNNTSTVDGEVYHLTFYSQKIGLQFQKVPPPPVKANGLLTEAMTADLARVSSAGEKTAAELRRIANISGTAKSDPAGSMSCQVAKPIDAVLVCGFVGFDDSSDNMRPKLGARLVAFDGISLEAGAWTFQSVRKAIQARRRPLTLSFRNDFLTTAQRKILTKAVKDMEVLSLPSTGAADQKQPVTKPASSRSGVSQRSSQIDDASSTTGSSIGHGHKSGSSTASFSKFRSFSEAGSSVSVLSAVGPLVSNLLGKRRDEPYTPEYLRRPPVSIEESPQHLDFKAELL